MPEAAAARAIDAIGVMPTPAASSSTGEPGNGANSK
jgi:hypothetical protein